MRLRVRLPNPPRVRPGVGAKLTFGFLAVILVAFVLLAASDWRQYRQQQEASAARRLALAEAARVALETAFNGMAEAARLAAAVSGQPPDPVAASRSLQALLAGRPGYLDAFLLGAQGQLVASAPPGRPPEPEATGLTPIDAASAVRVSDLVPGPPDGRPALRILIPAPPAGAVGLTVDARAIGAALDSLVQGNGCVLSICDRSGRCIYSTASPELPWEERGWQGYPHVRAALAGETGMAESIPGPGGPCDAVALPTGWGWVVTVHAPPQASTGRLRSGAPGLIVLFLALGTIALLGASALGNRFAASLARLADYARALGRGQLNERIDLRRKDEFGDLAAALNEMAAQMEERDRRLRARSAELEAIISQSAEGIAIYGAEGELLRLNPAGVRILGRSPERLGLSPGEQIACFHLREASGAPIGPESLPVAAALRGETRLSQELRVDAGPGEERYIAWSAAPLTDARGRIYGAVSVFRDATPQHHAQQERDDFISLVSHELKTPITSIKGYAQMLLRRGEEAGASERELKGLRIINTEVDRMVDLINQLLDVSRLETQRLQLDLERVNLVALAQEAVERLQTTTDRHTLRLRAPEEPLWVEGDSMRLAQVLGNLITNAIKYSPNGGPVEITLESHEGRGWVSVRDWGVGIAPEDQAHLFRRFYRGSRRAAG
ncbi:MAG: HAMP domain-containing protein, partial [Anaerolineae bacterium]|nr:HAMP domain-containing protein [Anaerolineae bacterium]